MFQKQEQPAAPAAVSFQHAVFPTHPAGRPLDFAPSLPTGFGAPAPIPGSPSARLSTAELDFIEWLFGKANVDAHAYKHETLARRIPACLRALKVTTLSHARFRIRRDESLFRVAMDAMLIGVTSFFRDLAIFAGLCTTVLPEMANTPRLRVWSAGCSNGAELYSVAMLLSELGMLHRAELLGTDCRTEAITKARQGVFDDRSIQSLPEHLRAGYFDKTSSGNWQIRDALRRCVHWRQGNALDSGEPAAWDLIFCRNLAIYLQPRAASMLWEGLGAALRPGGILVLGRAERPVGSRLLSNIGPCLYRRDKG